MGTYLKRLTETLQMSSQNVSDGEKWGKSETETLLFQGCMLKHFFYKRVSDFRKKVR